MFEGMPHDKTDGLASKTFAQQFRIENANRHRRTAVAGIEIVQPDLPDQPVVTSMIQLWDFRSVFEATETAPSLVRGFTSSRLTPEQLN